MRKDEAVANTKAAEAQALKDEEILSMEQKLVENEEKLNEVFTDLQNERNLKEKCAEDLKALSKLSASKSPPVRVVRSRNVVSAVYGFVDASVLPQLV